MQNLVDMITPSGTEVTAMAISDYQECSGLERVYTKE